MSVASVTLSEMQKNGIALAKAWFKNKKKESKVFTISGYAGTGKTTIVKALIEELGIKPNKITYVAPTGKAALQLVRNGNNATTIHKLIYSVNEDKQGNISFLKKDRDALSEFSLIIVDEVSMVSKEILNDLLYYGVPIIALGDSGQLEPIGEDHGLLKKPDVMLTEIHRQAADNPIIHLSMLARKGEIINPGKYGDTCYVLSKKDKRMSIDLLLRSDQVLCSLNKTRKAINTKMRRALGFTDCLPQKGDKIICTKNNWDELSDGINLINGLIGTTEHVENLNGILKMDFKPEFGDGVFRDLIVTPKEFLSEKLIKQDYDYDRFDFGNSITVHKSQGSQWDNICVYYEPMGSKINSQKLLYTAITRAKEKMILITD
ncbi:ATP-dependent DNA helicase [Anaerobacillus isosaccharinicus]|uniref:AAA family ATPase n=1 Tax=Anaerobacillus isosaccharinicus TaxID=1532552 RepID=A0A1S2M938_9BACI|nr:AAA family ATPase [Anaerobacillus isosaccharinicus]MBA5588890.1 AAA family ATPase [Anaerobacillus isosaccharinicus]QOY37700.1 AAA family ATPase [Anaerobacillus isosaccharinicus]